MVFVDKMNDQTLGESHGQISRSVCERVSPLTFFSAKYWKRCS